MECEDGLREIENRIQQRCSEQIDAIELLICVEAEQTHGL